MTPTPAQLTAWRELAEKATDWDAELNGQRFSVAFIAASRTALPALIAEVERLTQERDALRDALNDTTRQDLKDNINQLRDMVQALKVERDAERARADQAEQRILWLDSFDGVCGLLKSLLDEHYPATVFNGSSGDVGPLLIVAARKVLEVEAERDTLRDAAQMAREAIGGMEFCSDDFGSECPWCHADIAFDQSKRGFHITHLPTCSRQLALTALNAALGEKDSHEKG